MNAVARPDDPALFDWTRPTYDAVLAERALRLERLRADRKLLAEAIDYYTHEPAAFIHDWGCCIDPRVVARGRQAVMPLLLMPRQREMVEAIVAAWRAGEPLVIEKSRDCGASWLVMATSVTLALFNRNVTILIGSSKEEKVDRTGDPETLFAKARSFMQYLPREFKGSWGMKHSAHMRLSFPATGSAIVGEAGDNIGRGGRSSIAFIDESAHLEHPKLIDAALVANTDCRIDVSSVNGMANSFAERRHSGRVKVFTFHYRDDVRKGAEWVARKKAEVSADVWNAEYELDYLASVAGVLMKPEWVSACVDSHVKLGIEPTGVRQGAFDPADIGQDKCAFAARHGILITECFAWSGKGSDLHQSTERVMQLADDMQLESVIFDGDGLGAGVRAAANVISERRTNNQQRLIEFQAFKGSSAVRYPDARAPGTDTKNKDRYHNLAAQAWFTFAARVEATYRAVNGAKDIDPDSIISLSSKITDLSQLCIELSMPVWKLSGSGKIIVEKHEDGISPDRADCLKMMLGIPTYQWRFSDELLALI